MNRVIHGDCLEVMPTLDMVSLVVTSPPYNLNKKASGGGSSNRNYNGWYFDDMPELEYQEWQKRAVRECLRLSLNGVFYNHRIRYAWHSRNTYRTPSNIYHPIDWLSEFPVWCEIIWDRGGTTGHVNNRCRMSDERIYQLGKPQTFNDMGYTTVWKIPPTQNNHHPCSFPVALVERCILMCSNAGDTILDPFAGSGTTAIACINTNRNYILIEKEKEYIDIINKRISEHEQQLVIG